MLEIEWREIPAGEFFAGSDETRDNPPRRLDTAAFLMARFPVTNAQFEAFLADDPRWRKEEAPEDLVDADYLGDRTDGPHPDGWEAFPAAWVSWHAADAFCRWASRVLDMRIVLPTEAMWEKACRGPGGRRYPWGETIDGDRANFCNGSGPLPGRTADGRVPVGTYSPRGDSPYGCADMAGNVWEWCADWLDEYEDEKALRGGGWNFTAEFLAGAFRFGCDPCAAYNYIGFRCAALLE